MRHFVLQRSVQLALYATLARVALACGDDTDRGPPIGSPTGPIGPVVTEAGSTSAGGRAGDGTSATGGSINGGAFDTGAGAGNAAGAIGNGSAGRDPFGVGGSSATDPFGIGGALGAFSGTSSF